jgi:predicted Zn-dependent protease
VQLARLLLDGRVGGGIDRAKIDQSALDAAADRLAAAAKATGSGRAVRAAAGQVAEAKGIVPALDYLESWTKDHPTDLVGLSFELEYASRSGDPDKGFERVSQVAQRILALPEQPTSLEASIQADVRARALQVLIESAIVQGARDGVSAEEKAALDKQLPDLRAKLLACLQNDESAPGILQADAKILQSRGDLAGAAKKWETFFTKVPQPPADAFLWSTLVYRAQNDLGLAMQTATRGAEAYPSDIRLIVQRAELAASLGRFAEAAALFEGLSKAIPSEPRYARAAAEARARSGAGTPAEASPEIAAVETAIRAKDWAKARELVTKWVEASGGGLQAMYARALVEQEAGDRAKALEYAREALSKHPATPELARLEAMLATEDPLERMDMMIARLVPDEKQRPAERLRALRGLRSDAERQVAEMRRAQAPDLAKSEDFLAKINAALADAEKQATNSADASPQMVEIAFGEAVARGDFAAAELHVAAAGRMSADAPLLEPMLRSRLLEAQGRTPEAIQVLERLRQSGRNEAMVVAQLAVLQERAGNEPGSLALWKEAYDRRPNELLNVRGYARALGRVGQGKQALDMLRAAVAANPSDMDTVMMSAEFEAVYGSRAKAIELRQRALQIDSANRENLGDLYLLLSLPPDFGSVRDSQGRPRFDERTWASVPVDEQRRLLSDAQRDNLDAANRLYEAAMRVAPYDIRFAGRRAAILREAGKVAEARQAIDDVMARMEADGKASAQAYVDQALLLESIGQREAADQALAKAGTQADAKPRDLEFVRVEIIARRGDAKKAAEVLKAAIATEPTLPLLLRLADLQVVAGIPVAAGETLAQARTLLGNSPKPESVRQVEMLAAAVAAAEADVLRDAGKRDEAKARSEEALAALSRAQAAVPTDLNASLRRAELLRGQAIAQQDPAKYDAAVVEADRTLARNALFWPMVSLRTDLALDRRDIKSAIGILERYLEAQPSNQDARIRAMEMQLAAANPERAIAAALEGVNIRPTDPLWAERLGDIYVATNNQAMAAAEFERAFALEPTSLLFLEKAALARLGAGGSGEALALLRGANDLVQRSPVLGAIAASSLAKSGRRDEALVAGRDALARARAVKEDEVRVVQRTAVTLRDMFPVDRPADFEAYVTQVGEPTPVEMALLADTWNRIGPAGAEKCLGWCAKVEAMGDTPAPVIRATVALTKGNALYGKGDLNGAADAFVVAATTTPGNAAALNNAAYLLARAKGDTDRAYEFASKAVVLEPAQPDYLDTLGYVLLKANKLADAEDALTKSVAVTSTPTALLHLAQVRAAQGNMAEARQLVDRAKQRQPDPETAKEIAEFEESLKGK